MKSKPTQPVSWIKEKFALKFQVYRMQLIREIKEDKTAGTFITVATVMNTVFCVVK